jgi:hypothetical protein
LPPPATSSSVICTVVGTPSATPDASPKLLEMSRRTTPLSARTFGPLEPSPGYGPAVSSGISEVVVVVVLLLLVVPVAAVDPDPPELDDAPHAASAAEVALPARMPSTRRRLMNLGMSKSRPLSWSSTSPSWWWWDMSAVSSRVVTRT